MKLSPTLIVLGVAAILNLIGLVYYLINPNSFDTDVAIGIKRVTLDGHDYYKSADGHLTHSAACPNSAHK